MKVTLYFIGGKEARLDVDRDEWPDVFERALTGNTVLGLDEPDGGKVGINPRSVLYWKFEPDGDPQ